MSHIAVIWHVTSLLLLLACGAVSDALDAGAGVALPATRAQHCGAKGAFAWSGGRSVNHGGGGEMLRLRGGHASGYSLGVRDSIMIAHSFEGKEFGPAQGMHGATYTVDVEVNVSELAEKLNWVVDIGFMLDTLKKVLSLYNYKNLNEVFPGENTTTEFMSRKIHDGIAAELAKLGVKGSMCVKLSESHNAWASYTGDL